MMWAAISFQRVIPNPWAFLKTQYILHVCKNMMIESFDLWVNLRENLTGEIKLIGAFSLHQIVSKVLFYLFFTL